MLSLRKLPLRIRGVSIMKPRIGNIAYLGTSKPSDDHHDHSHDDHHVAGPYDPPHRKIDQDNAYFPGFEPGAKREGWEIISYVTIGITTLLLLVGPYMVDTEDFKEWAKREAIARFDMKEKGIEIEFGKYYQKHSYSEEGTGSYPTKTDD